MKTYATLQAAQQLLDLLAEIRLSKEERLVALKIAKDMTIADSQEKITLRKIDPEAAKMAANNAPNQ